MAATENEHPRPTPEPEEVEQQSDDEAEPDELSEKMKMLRQYDPNIYPTF